jgi:tetratricopeptide (TPR) repeat protein
LFQRNLATNMRLLGADHPNVAVSMGNLGLVLDAKGDATGAEQLFRDDLSILRKTLGATHPAYAQALNHLSLALLHQGRVAEAQPLIEQAIAIVRPILRPDHPRLVVYLVNRARVQLAGGDAGTVEPTLRHVLELRQHLYPPADWRIAQVESLLGEALTMQARYAEAETLLLDAANRLKPIPGSQGQEAADNRARLASLYRAWHRRP